MSYMRSIKRFVLIGSACIALSSLSTLSQASGSFSAVSGAGVQSSYNMGKAIFHKKVICSDCPAAISDVDEAQADELLLQIISGEGAGQRLNKKERNDVVYYLVKRYNLQ